MLTASIVLYKTPIQQISTVLNCVVASKCVDRLYVIDNFSTEENKKLFSEYSFVEYIEHENTGYGSSHNIALHKAVDCGSDYHVVLNPDIEFTPDVLECLAVYMEKNNDVVYMLPRVIYPNGNLQYLCKLLPTPNDLIFRRFFSSIEWVEKMDFKYSLRQSGYDKIMNPPCLSGCFMFLRVKTLEENNLFFDERYFMYLEDFDLMRRLHRVGKTLYFPKVTIIHNHAKESYKNKKMLKIHIQSAIKYFNKFGWFFDKERRQMNKIILKEIDDMMIKEL
ncbi:MAG: glycosyltransferase family 2 protein [Treponema sp.]|uniref:glycosyltransferase family 2 protein n=1 Tax=Treponema sp. TaxID=166 RepID=UPI00298E0832|nr:glycosyltransferase family 2 protein [Treponema sp.]MCQ2601713.1 glycosyltransferase family 2 protein [Treponema sp.]